jgi:ABC-type sugar transport system ATPase subunit
MTAPLLDIRSISKAYGATQALHDVSLTVLPGEIHAIIGENGAGKSTLINIVSGVVKPDSGEINFAGNWERIDSPQAAQRLGIGTVHQELSLADLLTVAENIFVARLPSHHGLVDWKRLVDGAHAVLSSLGLSLDPEQKVGTLPLGSRQLVEIAKALSLDARMLLLDEPTSALNANEKVALFELIRRLRLKGIGIIYISHHLNEITSLADRVTVLRDGRVVGTHQAESTTADNLVQEMVGHAIARRADSGILHVGKPLLEVRDLSLAGAFSGANFTIHSGEIISLVGLLGSGRSALASCLAGLKTPRHGTILIDGKIVQLTSLRHAMALGIGYVPPERKTDGLFLELSLGDNIVSASLPKFSVAGVFDERKQDETARTYIQSLNIRSDGPHTRCAALSGGNQQKVLLAKWLETKPHLLIVEEPTKGVDIASKSEIHSRLQKLAGNGMAILFVSTDLPEILALSHRILVMHRENIVAVLTPATASEQEIMALASGLRQEAA